MIIFIFQLDFGVPYCTHLVKQHPPPAYHLLGCMNPHNFYRHMLLASVVHSASAEGMH